MLGAVGRGAKRVQGMGWEKGGSSLNKEVTRKKIYQVPGYTGKEDSTNGGGPRCTNQGRLLLKPAPRKRQ